MDEQLAEIRRTPFGDRALLDLVTASHVTTIARLTSRDSMTAESPHPRN